ncbi:MAG: protein gvpF/L [Alkalinema sp. CACIAM 70d]|nr:MAG: protein gvpF/L [Alkalinema sp. CACIAM 70d]
MSHGLYLYGIFPSPGPTGLALEGLDQQPVQAQVIEDFVFLYSEAKQSRYLASRRNLLGHEKVLEKAMGEGYRTVLPLRFGLTISDWQAVNEELIAPRSAEMKALLARLDGYREVGVKVFWDAAAELQLLMAENAPLSAERDRMSGRNLSMDEVVRIGQAIEQAMDARRNAIITAFRNGLSALAIEVVENDNLTEAMVYNAAFLIPWDTETTFSQQVEAIDQQFSDRLKIRYNNFTAPYNFAQLH